uniref:Uncharacterized protein n=1 Tax=Neogobius melanostomus TaxID=47308 RepID=A0A8C6UQN1_9GOBI
MKRRSRIDVNSLCFSGSSSTFIQTNRDLLLTVAEGVQTGISDIFHWKVNGTINMIVEFFQQNLSLILKNVQLSDSGIYTAVVYGTKDETLSTHDVIVQVKVDSVFNSPESCNFTVSCRTELSPSISRSFTCDRHTCEEVHPPTPGPAPSVLTSSLQLSLTNERIICNHSNQVSWTQDTKNWREICPLSGKEGKVDQAFSVCLKSLIG